MKGGGGGGGGFPVKRRWKGLVIGVLFLVFLSMLVPLAFLLGLHNGFNSPGFAPRQPTPNSDAIRNHDRYETGNTPNQSERNPTSHVIDVGREVGQIIPKDSSERISNEVKNDTFSGSDTHNIVVEKGTLVPSNPVVQPHSNINHTIVGGEVKNTDRRRGEIDERGKMCELKFGSYCLWREENKEEVKDSMVKKLKDQLFVARAYYPTIAKIPSQSKFTLEMKQNIQDLERILSESTVDATLPPLVEKKLQKMKDVIARAKTFPVDCNNVDKKLRQLYDMTDDETYFHAKQSAFLYQLAVQTMQKSFHCLSMRLTVEYFRSPPSLDMEDSLAGKFRDSSLYHYVLISNNVLASSVVINSTVMNARESDSLVFHVLTDGENYFTMKHWFIRNTYKNAAVRVLNIEKLNLDNHDKAALIHLSMPVEYRVSMNSFDNSLTTQNRTHYLSTFSHLHFLLPEIFQNLKKVVILGQDVVVQQDLSALWGVNMEGKVNGAVQVCAVRLANLKSYIGGGITNKKSCVWMSGLNVIDLTRWRELDLTGTYRRLVKEHMSVGLGSVEAVTLRASLITFQDLVYALDDKWALSGLGHDYGISTKAIRKAAVLHYNGNMKPWLELGIPKYKVYWRKFLNRNDQFLSDCNVNP